MRRVRVLITILCVLILAVQCGNPDSGKDGEKKEKSAETAAKKGDNKDNKDAENVGKDDKDKKETEAVPVQVVTPNVGDISSFLLFSSNIDSEKVVDIYPMTYGLIEKINFDEGQKVKKGDILAVLDDREASINERKAAITYKNLQSEFERQKEIYEKQMLSRDEFERLRFNMESSKLDWDQKKLMLSYTRITTPISGVVTKRYIKLGNKIDTSQMSFSVVEDKEKIAVINIPEQEKNDIYIKQKTVCYSGQIQVEGFVKRISPTIDPESGTFKVTIDVTDTDGLFAVGQFVNIKVIKKVHRNVILLTKDAILHEAGKKYVFVVNKENKALKKQIEIGFEDGDRVEVVKGITKEEQVVTAGKSSLKNKTLVKVIEPVVS